MDAVGERRRSSQSARELRGETLASGMLLLMLLLAVAAADDDAAAGGAAENRGIPVDSQQK
jgi:hypothetical protein